MEIADDDEFAESRDYFRLLARQRVAADADAESHMLPEDVCAIERRYEISPRDRDGLFDLLLDRLEDLAHDLRCGDFSDRRTVRSINDEPEMQRTIAWRLCARANDAYTVTREEEVADGKSPDIRLLAVGTDQKVAVEIKIADRWSLKDLECGLRKQLVGQYLRHSNCTAGCLLLTYHGRKQYWRSDPVTRKRLAFHDVVSFLREKATEIERERRYDVRVAVFDLDLSDRSTSGECTSERRNDTQRPSPSPPLESPSRD